MNWFACRSLMMGWGGLVLLAAVARGQVVPAPTPAPAPASGPTAAGTGDNLDRLSEQMIERVRHLGELIAADLGKAPNLIQDARELEQALREFRTAQASAPNALRRRQLYSGVDSSWHHLAGDLGRPGSSTPKVADAAQRVNEVDSRIHKALRMNSFPAVFYGSRSSPGGVTEIQRLAHALVDRAEALAAVIRAEVRGPAGSRLAQEAESLAQAADIFHDGIDLDARADDLTRNGFAGVAAASSLFGADLPNVEVNDRVRAAWRTYRSTEMLIRQGLKLPTPPVQDDLIANPVFIDGQSPVIGLAARLVIQVDAFLSVFTAEAKDVREGGYFIADARRLAVAAAEFRNEVPRAIGVDQLAFAFRDVDALWERLARRTNRIAQGGEGADVQRIEGIGQTVAEIHRMLGMPGFPATVGPSNQ